MADTPPDRKALVELMLKAFCARMTGGLDAMEAALRAAEDARVVMMPETATSKQMDAIYGCTPSDDGAVYALLGGIYCRARLASPYRRQDDG